jgi:hypothetical protein
MPRAFIHGWYSTSAALLAAACLAACGGGGSSGYPAVGVVDGSEDEVVFKPGQVLTYEVTMTQEDWDDLEAHGILEEWMPASLVVRGEKGGPVELEQVGFRHKGAFGTLGSCWGEPTYDDGQPGESRDETLSRPRLDLPHCRKISYKFKFNEYGGPRFHGLKKLNLHAGSRDPSMLREMLAYSTYFDFGVDAPRTAPARLYINGEFQGLFIAVEDVDDRYAVYHYPDNPDPEDGSLYKEVWPNPAARVLLGEAGFTEWVEGGQEEGDGVTDFLAFTAAVADAVGQGSINPISAHVDVEGLLRYMAVDRGIKNWDGVTAMYTCADPDCISLGPHNYLWYRDTAVDGRFHLIPWDMDNTFPWCDWYVEDCGMGADHPLPNWNVKPADCSPVGVWDNAWVVPSGCDPFLNLLASTGWERFEELGRELAAGPLRASVLRSKAKRWAGLIEPIVAEDPVLGQDVERWRTERDALLNDILVRAAPELIEHVEEGYVVEEP